MFANRIRETRKARNIEPTELAFRIGRSTNTLGRYERGETTIPLQTARRIAEVLEVPLDELFPVGEPEVAA